MIATIRRAAGWVSVATLVLPAMAWAHGGGPKDDGTGCKKLGCWVWSCQEIEETVYDVTYKEIPKKIKVPYIKEIKEPVSCKVCVPIASMSLRECPEIDYCRTAEQIMVTKQTTVVDECGNCQTSETCEPHIKTCLTRTEVTRQIPVLEWQLVPVEDKFTVSYFVRDWKEEEVTLTVPVKTPRTIVRKVWSKIAVPDCGCESCCAGDCCGAAPVDEAPVTQPMPVEPDPVVVPDPIN